MRKNLSEATHPTIYMFMWVVSTIGLQRFWPIAVPESPVWASCGIIVVVLGGMILAWAQYSLRKNRTSANHSRSTTLLVTDGPFRFSRNPIYVAVILIFIGLSVLYMVPWGLIMVMPFILAVRLLTIRREELYLEREFGTQYQEYCQRVRRWV